MVGANYDDMALAATRLGEIEGGFVVVEGGRVLAEIPLPVAGLKIATFDWWMDMVLSITPPVVPFMGLGLTCFFTTLIPSTMR